MSEEEVKERFKLEGAIGQYFQAQLFNEYRLRFDGVEYNWEDTDDPEDMILVRPDGVRFELEFDVTVTKLKREVKCDGAR